MKSRSEIWLTALEELGAACSVSTTRDAETLARRVRREGDSVLTVTLPTFGKELERALASEGIPRGAFTGWSRSSFVVHPHNGDMQLRSYKVPGGLPKFLGEFMDLIFTSSIKLGVSQNREDLSWGDHYGLFPRIRVPSGPEEAVRMADAIRAVRQLTLMFGKEKELCSDARQATAIQGYIDTDQALDRPLLDDRAAILFEGKRLERTRRVISIVFGSGLSRVDSLIHDEELVPGHGPGATADRLKGNQKWTFPTWHSRMEHLFPYGRYAVSRYGHVNLDQPVKYLEPQDEPPVRVVLVPKTQSAPRLIAIEPTCVQYMQQAISRPLVASLESYDSSRWFVGFTDQKPNNEMAQTGSRTGALATLDLSEASDRVANWLVEDLFADFPWFAEGIDATRSTHAELPSGDVIRLLKFASMGSAMTFPIEAIIFASIAIERVLAARNLAITPDHIRSLRGWVRVYGDDIIVPNDCAVSVSDGLEVFGFKVNVGKSFWTGKFRESCGKEYWNGNDVSIVRFREKLPTTLRDVTEVVSTVSTRNQLYKAGMKKTVGLLDSVLGSVLKGHYPIVAESSPVLGRVDDSIPYEVHGYSQFTQSPFVKGYVVTPKIPENGIDGEQALMKCLLETIGSAKTDERHLTHSGRPLAVSMKLTKASPF